MEYLKAKVLAFLLFICSISLIKAVPGVDAFIDDFVQTELSQVPTSTKDESTQTELSHSQIEELIFTKDCLIKEITRLKEVELQNKGFLQENEVLSQELQDCQRHLEYIKGLLADVNKNWGIKGDKRKSE